MIFIISTNGKKPAKTDLLIASIKRMCDHPIIVAGVTKYISDDVILRENEELALNGKLAALRNAGAEQLNTASQTPLLFLDDDFIFPHTWYDRFIEYGDDWDILSNRILLPNLDRFWDRATYQPHTLVDYDYSGPNLYQTGGFWLMRNQVYQEHKWNDDLLIGQAEDIDMSKRVQAAGYEIKFDENNYVFHNDHSYVQGCNGTIKGSNQGNSEEYLKCLKELKP